VKLEGLLVDLVPFNEDFLKLERKWLNGPMREWWGQDGLLSEAGLEVRREARRARLDTGTHIRFGIRTKAGQPIGSFVLADIDFHSRTAEVGAGIGEPEFWGGGFGSDAMLLIVEYGYRWLDLRRLWLTTLGTNYRAQRQVEKCGFRAEGAQRQKIFKTDAWLDFLFYGMLREEWPGRDAMVERLGLREKAEARGYLSQ